MLRFVACVLFVFLLTATGLKAQEAADISDGVQYRIEANRLGKCSSQSVSFLNRPLVRTDCRSNFSPD